MNRAELLKSRQPTDIERMLLLDERMDGINVSAKEQEAFAHFFEMFVPLLMASLEGKDTVCFREAVSEVIANAPLGGDWKWALDFFVKKAVDGYQFDEEMTPEREALVCTLYQFFAVFINCHQEYLGKPLLGWAYWNYDDYFTNALILEERYIEELIETIDSNELLVNYRAIDGFDLEYYRKLLDESFSSLVVKWEALSDGADYGELPEWIGYLCLYIQDKEYWILLSKLFRFLSFPLLQATLAYQISSSEHVYNLMSVENDDVLCLIYLEMWHRDLAKEGATLQLYKNVQNKVRERIIKDGLVLFKQWRAEIPVFVERVFRAFETKFGLHTLFEWNFSFTHRKGSGLYTKEIREEVDRVITDYLTQAFDPIILSLGDANQSYLKFVCEKNLEKFKDYNSWLTLRNGIDRLFEDIHERPIPKFEAESLDLWRGYSYAFVNTSEDFLESSKKCLNEVRVYFEGYLEEDDSRIMLEKIYKESFMLSSFMFISELDDIDKSEREASFTFVVDRVFRQIEAAYGESVRSPYLVPLQTAILVASQINQNQLADILRHSAMELPDFYEVMRVIKVAKILDERTVELLRERWEDEKEVLCLRSQQKDKGHNYYELKSWMEAL